MKTLAVVSTLTIALLSTPLASAAGAPGSSIDKRQQHQVQRIKNGLQSGALTGREAIGLAVDQVQNRIVERRYKSDGRFTVKERLKLHRELNQSSRRIYRQKHDAQTR